MIDPVIAGASNQIVGGLIMNQSSFSTADIEGMVFYGESRLLESSAPEGHIDVTVVAGEYFVLEPEGLPAEMTPFPLDAGLIGWALGAE